MICSTPPARRLAFSLAGLLLCLWAGPHGARAQGSAGTVFERRDECIAAGLLSAEQCDFAYRNARAEYEQKAPRYGSRQHCERRHGRCAAQLVATGWDALGKGKAGGASYVPRFAGVRITGTGSAMRALPTLTGTGRVAFAGRPVSELQDKVAGRMPVTGIASRAPARHAAGPGRAAPHRGDRDDTVAVPMQRKSIGADVAPGLYVDPDGVEWYKPARRH